MKRPASTPDIIGTFTSRYSGPKQGQLDTLLYGFKVPIGAMMRDGDGAGFPMGMLRVERSGRTFDFSDDPDTKPVCGFLAWDRCGEAQDIVAWSPRDGWTGTWLGRAVLLGEHELDAPRMGAPLPVYSDVLLWFQAGRDGCVILDGKRARHLLESVRMVAATFEDGEKIKRLLTAPKPRLVIPAAAIQRKAA